MWSELVQWTQRQTYRQRLHDVTSPIPHAGITRLSMNHHHRRRRRPRHRPRQQQQQQQATKSSTPAETTATIVELGSENLCLISSTYINHQTADHPHRSSTVPHQLSITMCHNHLPLIFTRRLTALFAVRSLHTRLLPCASLQQIILALEPISNSSKDIATESTEN